MPCRDPAYGTRVTYVCTTYDVRFAWQKDYGSQQKRRRTCSLPGFLIPCDDVAAFLEAIVRCTYQCFEARVSDKFLISLVFDIGGLHFYHFFWHGISRIPRSEVPHQQTQQRDLFSSSSMTESSKRHAIETVKV